ncbi:Ulp1-like peptidase [Cucumis melo var. makuwa]|uniref:Ulp1-like peptidase n=1 Tax=Cucumis melo var. makuwa TaxID=1194695 RepID=A0A5A7V6N5_CUCMM|nr:Ulp1-like peptidase [Cucumis melo var. makuwa]TYK16432.1 Ulp1-like peptidase [Cucumis melo var. makuwa]
MGPKEDYIQLVGNSGLLEKFFKDKECIYVSDLEDIFLEYEGDDDDLIIKAVIEMTPEEEQLKIASGELFENLRLSTIVQSKNGGSKRGREAVNDEDDFKKSKKQKSKTKMKKAIRNLQDRVAVVEGQLTSIKSDIDELNGMMSTILKHIGLQRKGDKGDRKVFEGLIDHTLESEEVDMLRPKILTQADDEDVHTVGTPPWLRFNIELEKSIDVLEKKVDIGLEEPIDIVDDEVEIDDNGKKFRTHFDEDVTEI